MDLKLFYYLRDFLTEERKALFKKVLSQRTNHFTVVTEDVYQLHNTSAVIRSCDAFGIQGVHVIEKRFGKRIDSQIAMGAQKWVSISRYDNENSCIAKLKNQGYQIVATTPHGNAQNLHEFDITKKSALFFGTEKEGLSQEIQDAADVFLTIPMYGFTESLNISVSVAIILQNLVARLRESNVNWQLTEEEKQEIEITWIKHTVKSSQKIIERYYADNKN